MPKSVAIELSDDLDQFRLPHGVDARLQKLLDKQDGGRRLSTAERNEAEGLVNLAEMLSLLKLRVESARRKSRKS